MRAAVPTLVAVAAAALLAGCNEPLPSRALVDDLRVLGVRAEPPEAAPGTTITFEAAVGDVEVPARPYVRGWALCTPGDDGVATCGDPSRVVLLGTGASASWTVPADFLDELTPEHAAIGRDVYVVLGIELDGLDRPPQAGEHDVAFKRVRISTNPAPNRNPVLESLLLDGDSADGPLVLAAGERARVLAVPAQGSIEEYRVGDGVKEEEMRFTWLVTGGSVSDPVTWGDEGGVGEVSWKVPEDGTPADLMLWVVLRDGRGGTAWASQRVRLE